MEYEVYNVFAVGPSPDDVTAICLTREDAEKVIAGLKASERIDGILRAINGTPEEACKKSGRGGMRNLKPRKCDRCGKEFQPRGTRSRTCDECLGEAK